VIADEVELLVGGSVVDAEDVDPELLADALDATVEVSLPEGLPVGCATHKHLS
jgi:hypothetical protein